MTINILGINIYVYSICLLIAFLVGIFLFFKETKKHNLDKKKLSDYIFYLIIFSIIGARLYYVLFELDYYLNNPIEIFLIFKGGLAIYGGIIGGLLYTIYFCHKNKLNILRLTDILVISLIIGQSLGRWGNFFNKEAYGVITTIEYLQSLHIPDFIINNMYISSNYRIPTFLYESISTFIGFIILISTRYIFKNKLYIGTLTSIYLIYYGITRTIIEGIRTDSLMFLNIRISQFLSIIIIIIGIALLILSIFKIKTKYYKTT